MLRVPLKYITQCLRQVAAMLLDLSPLSDEISKCLRLDGRPASEFNRVSVKLNSPLDDTAIGLFVAEDVPRGNLVTTLIL